MESLQDLISAINWHSIAENTLTGLAITISTGILIWFRTQIRATISRFLKRSRTSLRQLLRIPHHLTYLRQLIRKHRHLLARNRILQAQLASLQLQRPQNPTEPTEEHIQILRLLLKYEDVPLPHLAHTLQWDITYTDALARELATLGHIYGTHSMAGSRYGLMQKGRLFLLHKGLLTKKGLSS